MAVTQVLRALGVGRSGGIRIGIEQQVGHVFTPLGRHVDLPRRQPAPAEFGEHRLDDGLLGLRFVADRVGVEWAKDRLQRRAEAGERCVVEGLEGRCLNDAAVQKILRKELALHGARV